MTNASQHPPESDLRYSAEENPPLLLSSMLAAQTVFLIVAGIVLTPAIVLRGANMPTSMEAGVIFFALLISGLITMLQARKVWRFGAGHILLMGTSGAFIAVAVTALVDGGMPLLMTLIVVSSLVQFLLAAQLGLLRRIITPLVGGTTIMLLAVTVMPIAFDNFVVPADSASQLDAPLAAGVTLISILFLSFFGNRTLKLWAPLIGIILGSLVSVFFGTLDTSRVTEAAWFGLPTGITWPGFDLSFSMDFWVLLPAFVIVTVVGAIETFGDGIAIQKISSREDKPVDYRIVQGALYADGLGNLLSGVAGTLPNTTYSTSISVVDMTGVASRRVGLLCGIFMVLLAFFPKISVAILSIPDPVVGAYIMVLILLLFVHGVRMVVEDGLSFEKGVIVGMGFWMGVGFQQQAIFADQIPDWLSPILSNGMTSGTIVTLLLVALLSMRGGKKASFKTTLVEGSIPAVQAFIHDYAKDKKWNHHKLANLELAAEETMLALMEIRGAENVTTPLALRVELRTLGAKAELDMAVSSVDSNIEELIGQARRSEEISARHLSLKILGMLADDVHHYQFHGLDFISLTLPVARPIELNQGMS